MEIDKRLKKFEDKSGSIFPSFLDSEEENFKIVFKDLSLKDKEEIIKIVISMYDKKKELLSYSHEILDVTFLGSFEIRGINELYLYKEYFRLFGSEYNLLIYIEELNLIKDFYWDKDEK